MPFVTAKVAVRGECDAIVVGSGADEGQTACTLTMNGVRVLMLEAGRNYDPERETAMSQSPEMAPLRGASTPEKPFGFYDATVDGGWQVPGEPYTQASTKKSRRFDWWHARMLGGRTNHWGRIALRKLLDFELDIGWAVSTKQDVGALFKLLGDRLRLLHLKDTKRTGNMAMDLASTDVGTGIVKWGDVVELMRHGRVEHAFVEQKTPFSTTPMDAVKNDYRFLTHLFAGEES